MELDREQRRRAEQGTRDDHETSELRERRQTAHQSIEYPEDPGVRFGEKEKHGESQREENNRSVVERENVNTPVIVRRPERSPSVKENDQDARSEEHTSELQ